MWFCLAVLWKGAHVSEPVREWYYHKFPKLLEDTLNVPAALAYRASTSRNALELGSEEALESYLNASFDPSLHERIRARIAKGSLVILSPLPT
jgi:hypothetical protein